MEEQQIRRRSLASIPSALSPTLDSYKRRGSNVKFELIDPNTNVEKNVSSTSIARKDTPFHNTNPLIRIGGSEESDDYEYESTTSSSSSTSTSASSNTPLAASNDTNTINPQAATSSTCTTPATSKPSVTLGRHGSVCDAHTHDKEGVTDELSTKKISVARRKNTPVPLTGLGMSDLNDMVVAQVAQKEAEQGALLPAVTNTKHGLLVEKQSAPKGHEKEEDNHSITRLRPSLRDRPPSGGLGLERQNSNRSQKSVSFDVDVKSGDNTTSNYSANSTDDDYSNDMLDYHARDSKSHSNRSSGSDAQDDDKKQAKHRCCTVS